MPAYIYLKKKSECPNKKKKKAYLINEYPDNSIFGPEFG